MKVSLYSPLIERLAADTIMPGSLLFLEPSGSVGLFPDDEGACQKIFAIENVYKGGSIDTPYSSGQKLFYRHCRPGDVVLAWLAPVQAADEGTFLTSSSGGTVRVTTGFPQVGGVVGVALEAVSTSGFIKRIKIEIG